MEQENYKKYIVPIIAISMFIVLLFTAGYAYFTANVALNSSNYQINLPAQTSLVCNKVDCNVTVTTGMMTTNNYSSATAKTSGNCSVSCTCSGTQGATCNYNVTLLEKGSLYTPSASLGTGKELTVKVTNQTGCLIQNSSSTETQVNSMRDKIVAKCSLTVPQGGSVTSNVYAEFKWYNLNIDQTQHASAIYEYELTTADRRIIYRNSTDEATIGDNISVLTSGYQTDRSNISQHYYLKHVVENNIIVESYACVKFTVDGVLKETCLRGGDPSYYGSYTGMSATPVREVTGASGNIQKIQNFIDYMKGKMLVFAWFSNSYSYTDDGDTDHWLTASSDGHVMSQYDFMACWVGEDGSSTCE